MEEVCIRLSLSAEPNEASVADKLLVSCVFLRYVRHVTAKTGVACQGAGDFAFARFYKPRER